MQKVQGQKELQLKTLMSINIAKASKFVNKSAT